MTNTTKPSFKHFLKELINFQFFLTVLLASAYMVLPMMTLAIGIQFGTKLGAQSCSIVWDNLEKAQNLSIEKGQK